MDENGQFIQSAKPNSVKMTEAVKKLHAEKGGVVLDINDVEDRALAEESIFLELKAFFDADESAIGWYDDKIKTAKKLYSMAIPEIATDKNAESVFEYLLAITSNGEAVISQNASIKKHMNHWLETGRLLENNQGNQANGMNKSFLIYNLLKEKGLTDLEIKQFFQITMSKKEIENHPDILELNEILEKPINITGESVNETVPMSFIFGSKIGSFYQNIIGNYEYLTMDRWFMRSMNRILGTPFKIVTDKTLEKNRRESLEAFQIALESGTEDEVARIKVATDEMGVDLINNSNITELASILTTKFQKDLTAFSNKAFNEVGWFYCTQDQTSPNKYDVYNYLENVWSIGELSRTAWLDEGILDKPLATYTTSNTGTLYSHEVGYDDDGTAMQNVFIESSDFDIDPAGENFTAISRLIPDVKFIGDGSTGSSGQQLDFVLKKRDFPGQDLSTATTANCFSNTTKIDTRLRARQIVLRVQSNDDNSAVTGMAFRLGATRLDIKPDGKR